MNVRKRWKGEKMKEGERRSDEEGRKREEREPTGK